MQFLKKHFDDHGCLIFAFFGHSFDNKKKRLSFWWSKHFYVNQCVCNHCLLKSLHSLA